MLEERLDRLRKLMEQRDKIDAELAGMLGVSDQPRRGRPRKEQRTNGETVSTSHGITVGSGNSQSTVRGSDAE